MYDLPANRYADMIQKANYQQTVLKIEAGQSWPRGWINIGWPPGRLADFDYSQ